ncbi:MAG: biotin--[acetyl-CoA-carboxylase] ligase [bacterium]
MIIGSKLYRTLQCADSMAWAKQNMAAAPDGAVFLADKLTHAKGRNGRVWKVIEGQLNITILLKPKTLHSFSSEDLPIRINQLNMAVSLGIYDAIKDFGIGIKWPNDFVVQSEAMTNSGELTIPDGKQVNKKVGGVLFHLVWEGGVPVGIVCGFAINVNNIFDTSDELFDIATSLVFVSGSKVEMRPLYKNLLISINNYYKKWLTGNFDEIYKLWRKAQLFMGKSIKIHQKDGVIITGIMMQVLPNGDLLLIESSGTDKSGKQKIVSFYMVEQVVLN